MPDADLTPVLLQGLGHQAAVTVIGLLLAAQQTSPIRDVPSQTRFDPPLTYQCTEVPFIRSPTPLVLLERVEEFLCRCEFGPMDVVDPAHFPQKKPQVILLREAGELRRVVEVNIDDALHARIPQRREEVLRGGLRESDGEELNAHAVFRNGMGAACDSVYAIRSACRS